MRIGIIGIGGIGGFFGGKLARAYGQSGIHEIIFIARGEHLKAIQQNGLQLFTRDGDYLARPTVATDNPAEAGIFDLVLFCVKSYALENVAREFHSTITSDSVVIPLLNGVNITERLN
jgi:2-dehydropantoate 2-reductase